MGNNIIVPFSGYIAGGSVHDGTDVVISGRANPNFDSFSINLCTGPNIDAGDVAMHFNPRFNQKCVVRNHKQGGSWGLEETNGGMPFGRGNNFNIHMKVHKNQFKITVNSVQFCDFHHRIPKESIQYLFITGDVSIGSIQFRQKPTSPTPFTTAIPGGVYAGKIIYITGTPHPNCSRFTVNLACGPYDSADYALHMDNRINYGNDHGVVVRNSKMGGKFGNEERFQNFFPFVAGVYFEIMILVEPQAIKIAVNNQHFTEFAHRMRAINRITHVNVQGDVSLTQVRFQ